MLPWHRALLGGYPRTASATFGSALGDTKWRAPFCGSVVSSAALGEVDVYEANDRPPPATGSQLMVIEYVAPRMTSELMKVVTPGRALANTWTEYVARADAVSSLFARPGRPWICADGALRDRVRAAIQADDRLPILAGLPRDILIYRASTACVSPGCTLEVMFQQLPGDARERAERFGMTKKLPAARIGQRFRTFYATAAHAGAAAAYQRSVPDTCSAPVQRGLEVFLTCTRDLPAL